MRFTIGQPVWRASFHTAVKHVTCPDCDGQGRVRVIFHNDTEVSIECCGCARDYDPPTGYVIAHERMGYAQSETIIGCAVENGAVRWRTSNSYYCDECDLFETEHAAQERAAVLSAEADAQELERIQQKEKPTRTWAWNASYHRRCLKEAQRQIDWHTQKLAVANLKSKQEKKL